MSLGAFVSGVLLFAYSYMFACVSLRMFVYVAAYICVHVYTCVSRDGLGAHALAAGSPYGSAYDR